MAAGHIPSDLLRGNGMENDRRIPSNGQPAQSHTYAVSEPYSNCHADTCANLDAPANRHTLAESNTDKAISEKKDRRNEEIVRKKK
jgi:hypothetical protein